MFGAVITLGIILAICIVVCITAYILGNGKGDEGAVIFFFLLIITAIVEVVYTVFVSVCYFWKIY